MKIVDLHVHSCCSDGTLTPSELVDLALQKGLSAFALTDHDTTAGLDEAIGYAQGRDILRGGSAGIFRLSEVLETACISAWERREDDPGEPVYRGRESGDPGAS